MEDKEVNFLPIVGISIIIVLFLFIILGNSLLQNATHTNAEKNGFENACYYLDEIGLYTNGYKDLDGFAYYCNSNYKVLDNTSNIAYYAEGDSTNVKKVYIVLNLHKTSNKAEINKIFLQACELLTKKATNKQMTPEIKEAITTFKTGSRQIEDNLFELKLNEWTTGLGYDYQFIISKV